MKKRNKIIIISASILCVFITIWIFSGKEKKNNIKIKVAKGDFKIEVVTSGELEAKNSKDILGPMGLRTVGIWNVQISDLVPEGTIVDSGAYVATLDRTEISNKLKDVQSELEKLESQYIKMRLDTTLELRNARDELINMKFFMEEKQIILEQSKYEPPATIRQAELDLEKAERTYNQAVINYGLKHEQAVAKMQEVTASLDQQKRRLEDILSVLNDFTVLAPQSGMVIYRRDWDGKKIGVGSQISTWSNTIATLPDFSIMISKTYVNEIDISKIQLDQPVLIGIDAFPEKLFTGIVVEVANVGEQQPGSDSKVFEVKVKVNEFDSILRPAMTTKNTIITSIIEDVLYIPIEAVFKHDSLTVVYKSEGNNIIKQEIITGPRNENDIIIEKGLEEGDDVLLNAPENTENLRVNLLNR
ncbi:MAG: HlyD family secretion protein [Bacteroidales bacterium]|nr:HlyD family secretion protein [Bacteroidales bacterium]